MAVKAESASLLPVRADKLIKQYFPDLTNRQVEESLERGMVVSVRGKSLAKGAKVVPENVNVTKLREHLGAMRLGNPSLSIPIIHETPDYWVIDKPAGIASHPISLLETHTVTHWAFAQCPQLSKEFPAIQPTLSPHRLDTGTSGCLIVARTANGFETWRKRFSSKEVTKRYLAWCWGNPKQKEFEVNYSLAHSLDDKRMAVPALGETYTVPVMSAQSLIRVLCTLEDGKLSLVEVICTSGVTHQVRVHLASKGFPIVGDLIYDSAAVTRKLKPRYQQLRAVSLSFDNLRLEVPDAGYFDGSVLGGEHSI